MADTWKAGLPAGILWRCVAKSGSLSQMRLVCKPWCAEIDDCVTSGTYDPETCCSPMMLTLPKFRRLGRLTVCEAAGKTLLAEIKLAKSFMPRLYSLSFRGCSLEESPDDPSAALEGISELTFSGCRMPNQTWFLDSLRYLKICFCPEREEKYDVELRSSVVRNSALNHLSLSFVDVRDWELGRLRNLRRLELYGCDFEDADFAEIGKIDGLEHLSARFCNRVTDAGMRDLPLSLETLDIRDSEGVETGEWLPRLARLTSLSISVNDDDEVSAKLSRMGTGTARRASLHVDVEASGLSGEGFDALAKHPNIASIALSVHFTSCTGFELKAPLAASLVYLSCGWCYNTDDFLRTLSGCPSLSRVNLSLCSHLSDAGLRSLPVSVKWLRIESCVGVTRAGLRDLRERLPELELVWI